MGLEIIQDAIIDQFRTDTTLDTEFSTELTGTVTSESTTAVVGVGTLFNTELVVGDYIGNPTNGYKKVTAITDALNLIIESAFTIGFSAATIQRSQITKGMKKNVDLTLWGRALSVISVKSKDLDMEAAKNLNMSIGGQRQWVLYGYLIVVSFYDEDSESSETRKSNYEKWPKNSIESDYSFGGACSGNTAIGETVFIESPDIEGIYYGTTPFVCYRRETAGAR